MYYEVNIADIKGDIRIKQCKTNTYVQILTTKEVVKDGKKINKEEYKSIGTVCGTNPDKMHPDHRFFEMFPDAMVELSYFNGGVKEKITTRSFEALRGGLSVEELERKAWEAMNFTSKDIPLRVAVDLYRSRITYLDKILELIHNAKRRELIDIALRSGKSYEEIMEFIV